MVFAAQGVTIPPDASEGIVDAISSANAITIMVALVPLLIVPSISLYNKVKEFGFQWAFLRDRNFITHIVSAIMLALELGGVIPLDLGKALAGGAEFVNSGSFIAMEPATKERVVQAA